MSVTPFFFCETRVPLIFDFTKSYFFLKSYFFQRSCSLMHGSIYNVDYIVHRHLYRLHLLRGDV